MIAIRKGENAPESAAVRRARSKLERQLEKEHSRITETAVSNMGKAIEHRLQTAKERVPLKNKDVKIFDTNSHTANIHSQFVRQLRSKIERT
jgi:hypothetical protein